MMDDDRSGSLEHSIEVSSEEHLEEGLTAAIAKKYGVDVKIRSTSAAVQKLIDEGRSDLVETMGINFDRAYPGYSRIYDKG